MFKFFSPRRQPGWMAIVIQDGAVTLAHAVRRRGSRPELRRLDRFAVDTGETDALRRLRGAHRLRAYACTTLIGDGKYNLTPLDAPAVPLDERREALRWSLKEMVNYPVDSACLAVLDVPNIRLASGRAPGVLVASAAEPAVRSCVAPVAAAKVGLSVVDIPELAQRNVAALFEDDNRGLALLRIDEHGMMLTLTFGGELVAVRRGETNSLQLTGGSEEQRARVRGRLLLDLQRSLDSFDRQYSHITISRVILACYPQVDNLRAEFSESIYFPVVEMDLSAVMDFPALPEMKDAQYQARNLLAIGAALRSGGGAA